MQVSFSIIICCYNSTPRLEPTLAQLSKLDYPTALVEVLLIDNASTDGTAAFAQQTWEKLETKLPLKHIHEAKAGQAHARKTGILAAQNDYILFVDDDNWLASDYLKNGAAILQKNPTIGVLGGKITGVFETPPPAWMYPPKPFKPLIGNLAISTDLHQYGELKKVNEYVFGAGSFYKRSALQGFLKQGITPLLSGRSKEVLTSGDDIELCLMMRMAGFQIYRSNTLQLQHYITSNRLTWDYFKRLYFGFGYSDWITGFYENFIQNGKHAVIEKPKVQQEIERKQRIYQRYARLLKLTPFGESFQKNKLFLLVEYEKGRKKFLNEEYDKIAVFQNKIQSYSEILSSNSV